MRFDIRSLDEMDEAVRETIRFDNRMAELDALDAWLALPEAERVRLLEEADAMIPEDVRWLR